VLLVGSWVATKVYKNAALCESLLLAAYPPITVAVALAVPAPRDAGWFGPPQLAGAAAAVMFLTLLVRGGPRKRIEPATFVVVVTLAVTAATIAAGYGWSRWLAAGAILFGLFIVTSAAKLTVAFARIALPPVPAPGETVEHDELLDPVAGVAEPDDETPTWQAIIASVPQNAARLTERSKLAKQLLIGFVSAGTLILAVGAIALVVRGHFFVHSLVVAGLITVACTFRARLYAERWCAWALLAAAVAVPTGVITRLSQWYPQWAWLLLAGYLAAVVLALIVVTSTAGVRRISPVTKRMLELVDGVAVAAIIPMLLWIAGVYDLVRNIKF
jgi:ESX secretion system protein EccD